MKLYIYEHCPFSARVRYVAGALKLKIDMVTLDYDDETTTTALVGSKQVPVLVNDTGVVMAESLDIIGEFLKRAGSTESNVPSKDILAWQTEAFLPLQKIGYPRWASLPLKEFASDSAKQAWRAKKETSELNFDKLLAETANIAGDVAVLIQQASELLNQKRSLVDESILFSILRGFFSASEVKWVPEVAEWMTNQSQATGVKLLKV